MDKIIKRYLTAVKVMISVFDVDDKYDQRGKCTVGEYQSFIM